METKLVWSSTRLFHTSPYRRENQLSISFIVWHKNERIIFGRSNVQHVFSAIAKKFVNLTSEEVKNLVCNWASYSVKNVLLFFNSELNTSCKKGVAGYNPLQRRLIIIVHVLVCKLVRFSKILPKYCNHTFSFKEVA